MIYVFGRRIGFVLSLAIAISMFTLGTTGLRAQETTADILGTVTDSSGALLPNASITVRNKDTGEIRTLTSSRSGEYAATALQVGNYSVSIKAAGFKDFIAVNVTVAAGDRARLDARMLPGAGHEEVTVSSSAPALQTDESSSGDLLTGKSVQDLPTNGRNYVNLVQITAGVNAGQPSSTLGGGRNSDQRQTQAYSANGQADVFNNNMIDGMDNNAGAYIAVRPSIDAIDEIKVLTNNYSADLGRAAGAVVNIVTKAGTNTFHGDVYEYVRNDIFDARDFFARTGRKPELRLNQFGGGIGGPLFKNKTFFFADVEAYRYISGATGLYTVPTAFEEQNPGNFSDQCDPYASTPSNCVPGPILPASRINPIGLDFFKLYPTPNLAGVVNNYQGVTQKQQNFITYDARVDQHFSEKDLLFVRFSYDPVHTLNSSPFPPASAGGVSGIQSGGSINGVSGNNDTTTYNAAIGYTHIFTPNLLMQANVGYVRLYTAATPLDYGRNIAQAFGMQNVNLPQVAGTSGLTNVYPIGLSNVGDVIYLPAFTKYNNYLANASATYTHRNQTIRFGGAIAKREYDLVSNPYPVGLEVFSALNAKPYFYYPFAAYALLAGVPVDTARGNQLNALIYEYWEPSGYVQDDWHATQHLTLNLGLRYEVFPPNTEKRNRTANFDLSTLNLDLATTDSHLGIATGYGDFQPRVGFALELPHQAALHGGFGITFYPIDYSTPVGSNNPPSFFTYGATLPSASISSLPVPVAPNPDELASTPTITTVNSWAHNFSPMYIEQFSLEAQKQFGNNVLTVGYVGELGRKMPYPYNANEPAPPGPTNPSHVVIPSYVYAKQYPYLQTITANSNAGEMSYNSARVALQRRTAHGLTYNINYTYARELSDTFNPAAPSNGAGGVNSGFYPDPSYDYGNSELDIRNRLAGSIAYEIPFGKDFNGFKAAVFKGWQTNLIGYWQSGLPFTVVDVANVYTTPTGTSYTQNLQPAGGAADRPNMVSSAKLAHPGINSFFNVNGFQLQTLGTAGDEARNQLYGPHDRRVDFSLFKGFHVYERLSMQFRAEFFNIFNIANFAVPNNQISTWNANGTPSTTGNNLGTISSTAAYEIPRQIQFALKASF